MLGREYPGAAYRALQRVLLDLTQARDFLLAIASKNNPRTMCRRLSKLIRICCCGLSISAPCRSLG